MPRAIGVINEACARKCELDIADLLTRALADAGLEPDVSIVEPPGLNDHLRSLDPAGADRLVSVGGDGTLRSVAEAALRTGLTLGLVPMGTMNLLAKDLGIPLDVNDAIAIAAGDNTTTIDAGRVNDVLFLHSSVLGIVPRLGRWRERLRRSSSVQESATNLARIARVLGTIEPARLSVDLGNGRERVETFALAIAVGRVAMMPPEPLRRPILDAGHLALYLSHHEGRAGLLTLLTELGVGLWGIDAQVEVTTAERFIVTGAERRILVSNDGEVRRFDAPLRYDILPRALRVHVPPPRT